MTDFFDYQDIVPQIGNPAGGVRFRLGVVQAVAADRTCSVTVAGGSTVLTGIKYLANVQPLPGKPVWLVSDGLDMFAFGVQAANDRTFSPRASRSTTQSIADATDTAVSFDAVQSDAWGAWAAGAPTRLTAPMTGRYVAVGTVHFAGNATGFRALWVEKTGTSTLARVHALSVGAGSPTWMNIHTQAFDMTAGTDYIRLMVRQNSGGALDLSTSSTFSPALSLIYLGA